MNESMDEASQNPIYAQEHLEESLPLCQHRGLAERNTAALDMPSCGKNRSRN